MSLLSFQINTFSSSGPTPSASNGGDWGNDEDWDNEAPHAAYDPMKKIEEARGELLVNPMNKQR
jgi:hypothetical protein